MGPITELNFPFFAIYSKMTSILCDSITAYIIAHKTINKNSKLNETSRIYRAIMLTYSVKNSALQIVILPEIQAIHAEKT